MLKGLAIAATTAACAILLWIMGVLLLTRQTCLLLILMSGLGICAIYLACLAHKRGSRVFLAFALAGLALAAGFGFMALVDMLEPETLSFQIIPNYCCMKFS